MVLEDVLYPAAALIALTNPLAEIPVFLSIVAGRSDADVRRAAIEVAAGVWAVLFLTALIGLHVLAVFGIDVSAFRAAGGLLLVVMGMEMLLGRESFLQRVQPSAGDPDDALWMPLIMPMLAGPGAIVTTLSLSIREDLVLGFVPFATVLAISVAALLVLVVLSLAGRIARRMRRRTMRILTAFSGLILVAIGFQMGLTGIADFLHASRL